MDELFEQDSVRRKFVPKRRMSQSGSEQDRKEPRDKGAVEHIETV